MTVRRSSAVRTRATCETRLPLGPTLDEVRCAHLAAEVNHHAKRIPHYRQVRKDARRPEQRVPVTRDDLHLAEAPNGGLEFPVEIGECRWPIFEQGRGAADPARVTLIHLTKGTMTPRTCPSNRTDHVTPSHSRRTRHTTVEAAALNHAAKRRRLDE